MLVSEHPTKALGYFGYSQPRIRASYALPRKQPRPVAFPNSRPWSPPSPRVPVVLRKSQLLLAPHCLPVPWAPRTTRMRPRRPIPATPCLPDPTAQPRASRPRRRGAVPPFSIVPTLCRQAPRLCPMTHTRMGDWSVMRNPSRRRPPIMVGRFAGESGFPIPLPSNHPLT